MGALRSFIKNNESRIKKNFRTRKLYRKFVSGKELSEITRIFDGLERLLFNAEFPKRVYSHKEHRGILAPFALLRYNTALRSIRQKVTDSNDKRYTQLFDGSSEDDTRKLDVLSRIVAMFFSLPDFDGFEDGSEQASEAINEAAEYILSSLPTPEESR